ncbi:unnamed protein product [Caenorhabditis angaria]|uniref:G-protein coupled receptors family 1 profile domain-containing protein n=1 Tax=Caenorhabditis angaria TaxID=860376 RepID=A0A9P1IVY7_9PELO|nr:unnamed protein product [Caenorhabditis angaria]
MWLILYHFSAIIIGIFLNTLLIFTILKKSPPNIKKYAVMILNFAITDLLATILDGLVMQRLVACGISVVYISMGPCNWISSRFCFSLYILDVHMFTHTIWILICSFLYRYYVLIHPELSRLKIQIFITLVYLPSSLILSNIFLNTDSEHDAFKIMTKSHPEINITGLTLSATCSIFEIHVMYTIIVVVGLGPPLTITCFILRNLIIQKVKVSLNSSDSKKLHLQFIQALTFQACIPVFYVFAGMCYIVQVFDLITNEYPADLLFCFAIIVPILNPISSFIYIGPYRKFIGSFFRKQQGLQPCLVHPMNISSTIN